MPAVGKSESMPVRPRPAGTALQRDMTDHFRPCPDVDERLLTGLEEIECLSRSSLNRLLVLYREVVVHQICKRLWIIEKGQVEGIQRIGDFVEVGQAFLMLLRVGRVSFWKTNCYSSFK